MKVLLGIISALLLLAPPSMGRQRPAQPSIELRVWLLDAPEDLKVDARSLDPARLDAVKGVRVVDRASTTAIDDGTAELTLPKSGRAEPLAVSVDLHAKSAAEGYDYEFQIRSVYRTPFRSENGVEIMRAHVHTVVGGDHVTRGQPVAMDLGANGRAGRKNVLIYILNVATPQVSSAPTVRPDPAPANARVVPGVGMELVRIKAGSFLMGSPETEVDRGALQGVWDLEAQHRVTLTKDFWLGRFPVTQSQWRAVMADGQETPPRSAAQQPRPAGDDYPMNFVSWDDAAAFTAALTARERAARRLPAGYEYRLPTEAEWEYAARAGTTSAHAGDVDAIAWHGQNSGGTIHPVGQKTPNAWGLFDMFGNVSQWCIGWGQRQYPDEAQTDPNGGPGYGFRIHRGGGFSAGLGQLRSAARSWQDADRRYAIFGFRVALAPAIPASILRPIENAPFIPPPIWIDTTDFDYPAGATLKPIPNRTAADSYIQSIPGAEVSSSGGIVGGIQTSGGGHLGIGFGANMPSRTTEGLLEIPYSGFQMSRSDNATRAGSKIRFATHVTTFDNGEPRALEQGFVMHSVGMQIVVRGTVEPGRPILLDYGGGSAAWEPNGSPMDAKRLKLLRPIPDSSPLEPLDPLERLTPAAPQPEEKVVKPIIVEPRKQANIFSFGFPSKSDPN